MKYIDGWWCPPVLSGPGKYLRRAGVIDYALTFWQGPRQRAIQAGAHIGTFPRQLAESFTAVTCIEAEPANYACLVRNVQRSPRITPVFGALGATPGTMALNVQPHSSAGHHIAVRPDLPAIVVPVCTIDGFGYDDVNAIALDIEGYELFALQGAAATLARCHPLLVVEVNGCSHKYGYEAEALVAYLATYGYYQVAAYGEDRVFVSDESCST